MAGVAMERMALWSDREREQRGGFAACEVGGGDARGGFVERVDEAGVASLLPAGLAEEVIAGAVASSSCIASMATTSSTP